MVVNRTLTKHSIWRLNTFWLSGSLPHWPIQHWKEIPRAVNAQYQLSQLDQIALSFDVLA